MIVREYKSVGGICVFDEGNPHADYPVDGLQGLYRFEEEHFWFIARKEFLLGCFERHVDRQSRIIEIGAGTGNVARHLMAGGYRNICVGEISGNGLEYAKSYGIKDLFQFDLMLATFENEFDVVGMFDVLEHITNDDLAIQNVRLMLRGPESKIVLTVPAHQWLWNRADRCARHKRRYTKKALCDKLQKNGFKIIEAKYFFSSITPFLLLRRFLKPDSGNVGDKAGDENLRTHPVVNKFLTLVCRLENRCVNLLPNFFGGSLCIVARKDE
jgi:SAM-dependent methyltransferase